MAVSPGQFRRAEDASNAQGVTQTAVEWALQNAKKNPTPENIAIAKDTFSAQQATKQQQIDYAKVLQEAQAAAKSIDDTMAEVNANISAVNVAGQEAGAISQAMGGPAFVPINTVSTSKSDSEMIDAMDGWDSEDDS